MQDVEAVVFDRELEVLHVLEMLLEERAYFHQRLVRGGHFLGELRNRVRRAHAGDNVFALGVDEIFAVENFLAAGRIAGEGDASGAGVAHVAEDHRLHVDGRAPIVGDAVFAPINDRAVVIPGTENGADRAPELGARILRKRFAGALLDQILEALHEFFQIIDRELDVGEIVVAVTFVLEVLDHALERLVIFARALLHAHHDVAVHLQKTAIRIPGEARVVRLLRDDLDHGVVHPEVEDGVHHPGHGIARAGADRNEQRTLFVAEFLADRFLHLGERGLDLRLQSARVGAFVFGKIGADLGRDRESGRDRQTDPRHLSEVGAFAAQERLHAGPRHRLCRHQNSRRSAERRPIWTSVSAWTFARIWSGTIWFLRA